MIQVSCDEARNTILIEFSGKVDAAQAETSYRKLQKVVPKCGKGFRILTDFTSLEMMEDEVQIVIKKSMDYFNQAGVSEILRVIPDPNKDFGLNILSLFHYSKDVKFYTFESRQEAEERSV